MKHTAFLKKSDLAAISVATFLSLTGCGSNPYKEAEKTCKVNCEKGADATASDVVPRRSQPVPLSVNFWDANTARTSPARTGDEKTLEGILQSNPFAVLRSALESERQSLVQAAAAKANKSEKAKTELARCLIAKTEGATTAVAGSDGRVTVASDYGRCVPLSAPSNAKNAQEGIEEGARERYVVNEYEGAFRATLPSSALLVEEARSAVLPKSAIAWASGFPFRGLKPADVARREDGTFPALPFEFQSVFTKGTQARRQQKILGATREFSMTGAGYSPLEAGVPAEQGPLRAQFDDDGASLVLLGSLYVAQGQVLNPEVSQPYRGEKTAGKTVEFVFAGFTLKGDDLTLDSSLGFRPDVEIAGSYYIFVNSNFDPKNKTPQKNGSIWKVTARPATETRPKATCEVDVAEVIPGQGERAVGGFSLCD